MYDYNRWPYKKYVKNISSYYLIQIILKLQNILDITSLKIAYFVLVKYWHIGI